MPGEKCCWVCPPHPNLLLLMEPCSPPPLLVPSPHGDLPCLAFSISLPWLRGYRKAPSMLFLYPFIMGTWVGFAMELTGPQFLGSMVHQTLTRKCK